jgi:hypothetical protein
LLSEGGIGMDKQGGQMLLDRWVEDEGFRTQMRSDSLTAARSLGVELSDEDIEFLGSVDWTLSDEELEQLLEKRFFC